MLRQKGKGKVGGENEEEGEKNSSVTTTDAREMGPGKKGGEGRGTAAFVERWDLWGLQGVPGDRQATFGGRTKKKYWDPM